MSLLIRCARIVLLISLPFITTAQSASFLVVSDIHLDDAKEQIAIRPLARDAGTDTWAASQQEIKNLLCPTDSTKLPRFLIFLGDLPMHAPAAAIPKTMTDAGQVLGDLRRLAVACNTPLIYVPGNNDSPDSDYANFSERLFQNDSDGSRYWPVIGSNCSQNKAVITPGSDSLLAKLGCYSAWPLGPQGKLRVIVLNTVLFTWHHMAADRSEQCREELAWLGHQLHQVRTKGESALIVMHVPPGNDVFRKTTFWDTTIAVNNTTIQNNFLDTIDRYRVNIIGLLGSHTHMDGFKRLYNRNGQFTNLFISVPAVAPSALNNSALKLITYDDKFHLTRCTTLYLPTGEQQWQSIPVGIPGKQLKEYIAQLNDDQLDKIVGEIYNTGKKVPNLFGYDTDVRRSR
jgi:sphingomyelin phosphodiesterase acid-like 3